MKKVVLLLFLISSVVSVAQSTFEENGILYMEDLSDPKAMAVVVIAKKSLRTGEKSLYSGDIRIPAQIIHDLDTYNVIGILKGAFYCDNLSSLVIEDGIEFIEDYSIWSSSLKTLTLPGTVKTLSWVQTENLKEIKFGEGIETLSEISLGPDIKNIDFPQSLKKIKGFSVEGMSWSTKPISVKFGDNVEELEYCLRQFAGETLSTPLGCKNIKFSFEECPNLTKLNINEGPLTIEGSFEKINNLSELSLPNSVRLIESSFIENGRLSSLSLGDNVESIKKSFLYIPELKRLTLPNSLKKIDDSFKFSVNYNKPKLEIVHFGEGYKDITKLLGSPIRGLDEMYCPWTIVPSSPTFDYDYRAGDQSIIINVPKGMVENYIKAWGLQDWKGVTVKENLKNLDKHGDNILSHKEEKPDFKTLPNWFVYESVTYYILNENEVVINAYNGGVRDLVIPEEIIYEGYSFKVVAIENNAFHDSVISTIVLPSSLKYIGDGAFNNCFYLASVKCEAEEMDYIGSEAFGGCNGLKEFPFPRKLKKMGERAFIGCNGLVSITLPKGLVKIPNYSFAIGDKLSEIIIPEGVEVIGEGAFNSHRSLKKINLPSTIKEIEDYAFADCFNLQEIIVPKDAVIASDAFEDCEEVNIIFH